MADDSFKQEMVTTFLLRTCTIGRQIHANSVISSLGCLTIANYRPPDETCCFIPMSTGSAADFYIQPILSCVSDIDIMFHLSNQLAIPAETAPPTQLPGDFDSVVRVFEIIDDGRFPGYVFLESSYVLAESIEGNYIADRCARTLASKFVDIPHIFVPELLERSVRHGPALANVFYGIPRILRSQRRISGLSFSVDQVYCMRCLSWPTQAAEWPTRHRNYGWPDSATVARVISEGSDVVQVAHRQCRQDEWMSLHQYRLSFSRAEIILLNSWMPVQQIVYHMLRVFVKMERLTGSADNSEAKTLSNYHIKTLMLWACELKPRSWWTDDVNIVRICVQLLHTLAAWLTDARCQHYFINNCNLFDHFDNWLLIRSRLMSETEASLAEWFIDEYVCKTVAELSHEHILWLFEEKSSRTRLQNAVSEIVNWRLEKLLAMKAYDFHMVQGVTTSLVSLFPLSRGLLQSSIFMTRRFPNIDQHKYLYFIANIFLHVAYKTTRDNLTDELLDILFTICLQSNDRRRCINARHSSVLSLSQAAKLMKVVANNSRSTVQMIDIELSKAYLHRALRCKDSDSDSIYCLANVYLAVLYYTTGQYQKAIDHCTLVMRSHDHSQCSSHVVQSELLPKIDDNVDSVLGLATFYHYVQTAAFNQQQHHVSVFTTEFFAHYLHIKCLSVGSHQLTQPSSSAGDIQRYQNCFREFTDMFVTDALLHHLENCSQSQTSYKYSNETVRDQKFDTRELVDLLQQSAVEHLTRFRHFTAQLFESEAVTAKTDFEAMYAYKSGDYQRCLHLSVANVRTLVGQSDFLHACVFAKPEFIQLMDDDIASLAGLALIVNPSCRYDFRHFAVSQVSLLLYLTTQCQLKLHHSLTALAQTLRYVQVVRRRPYHGRMKSWTFDKLLLKLSERKILMYVTTHLG